MLSKVSTSILNFFGLIVNRLIYYLALRYRDRPKKHKYKGIGELVSVCIFIFFKGKSMANPIVVFSGGTGQSLTNKPWDNFKEPK